VTEAVVELEVVEIEEEDRDGGLPAGGLGERQLQVVDEQGAVRQAGEGVMERLVPDFVDRARTLHRLGEHVADRVDEIKLVLAERPRGGGVDA
jgi:hypothetical protein